MVYWRTVVTIDWKIVVTFFDGVRELALLVLTKVKYLKEGYKASRLGLIDSRVTVDWRTAVMGE